MKKTRDSDEQIVRILRETDRDTVAEVAKRHGVSEETFYARLKKFDSLATDEVKRWETLKADVTRLRKLLVDREVEIDMMKGNPPLEEREKTIGAPASTFRQGDSGKTTEKVRMYGWNLYLMPYYLKASKLGASM